MMTLNLFPWMSALRWVNEGDRMPWWAGIAYWDASSMRARIAPFGLHLIIGFVRRAYHAVRFYKQSSVLDRTFEAGEVVGRARGKRDGQREVWTALMRSLDEKPRKS